MPDLTPAQLRRAALLALVWLAADCALKDDPVEDAGGSTRCPGHRLRPPRHRPRLPGGRAAGAGGDGGG